MSLKAIDQMPGLALFAFLIIISPCASSEEGKVEPAVSLPTWVKRPPETPGFSFFVGESSELDEKEEALEGAWANSLVRIGMSEFPEVSRVTTRSVETLSEVDYKREFILKLELVDWTGVKEATELGSPFLENRNGKWVAYRLIKWSHQNISEARKKIKLDKKFGIPLSPEAMRTRETELVAAVRAIDSLNQRIGDRNKEVWQVLGRIKCGVTVQDLQKILGPPDRTSGLNCNLCDQNYFWGNYKVEAPDFDHGVVRTITAGNGMGKEIHPCWRARY